MSIKITNITIPINEEMPDISSFSPEENLMMIKIGSEAIVKGRNFVAGIYYRLWLWVLSFLFLCQLFNYARLFDLASGWRTWVTARLFLFQSRP